MERKYTMKKIGLQINASDRQSHINPEIYGHFSEHLGSCMYNGIYVGKDSPIPNKNGVRTDIIEAFKAIRLPVLRWPGGCFAEEYHWKDGIGSDRKKRVNLWGHVTEDNSFGTHEFFELCGEIGCEPYLALNLGSGTVQELMEWIEYITFDGDSEMADLRRKNGREKPWKLKYVGIGNENWGAGGSMRPEYYADEYRKYQAFCKNFSGNELFKVACGSSGDDYNWADVLLQNINDSHTNGISLHYYTVPSGNWDKKGSATDFTDEEYYNTVASSLYIDEVIKRHINIMDYRDKNRKIGLVVDEWGNWYDVEPGTNPGFLYQQSTMRDAITAACTLNIFNNHSDRIVMANLAQAVNVLQSLILTEGEKLVKTPTYHVFDLYKEHQNGTLLYTHLNNEETGFDKKIPMISVSASEKNGVVTVTLANCSLKEDAEISCDLTGFSPKKAKAEILSCNDVRDKNYFDDPERLVIKDHNVFLTDGGFTVTLPACSVTAIELS